MRLQEGACHLESSNGRVISKGVPRKLCSGPMLNLALCPFAVAEKIVRSRVSKVLQIAGRQEINKGERELTQREHEHNLVWVITAELAQGVQTPTGSSTENTSLGFIVVSAF